MTTAGGWDRIREVFHAALEQPPAARNQYVSHACGGDATMRNEVLSLLAASAQADGFLERPAARLDPSSLQGGGPALRAGDILGNFEVVGALGAGGMGEVYRARDRTLQRDVAIKLLPPAFASDPQRLARFERESRVLASLSHPHIAAIHSVEHVGGLHVLVLELVEGETLGEALRNRRLPLADVLQIGIQIAGALGAAHARGVVHRDLKPENVKLTVPGGVKLLDFGLAKSKSAGDRGGEPAASIDQTSAGLILGTCAYMSPEQARGKPVDRRTDVWAFGCVLFEMLTGRRAFAGETTSDTIAAVLGGEPDWSALPPDTPRSLRRVIRRCLEKDPERRIHDIADARLELEDAQQPDAAAAAGSPQRSGHPAAIAAVAVLAAIAAALGWWLRPSAARESARFADPARFTWALPPDVQINSAPAVSPDGRRIAFTAWAGGALRLFIRSLDSLEAKPVAGTEGAKQPFWSPDSRSVAFFARGRLMRVTIDGGAPVDICAAPDGRGGTWNAQGVIVFSPDLIESALSRVSIAGGPVEAATVLDPAGGENSHRWPVFLPDGVHFLYFVRSRQAERRGVYVGRIDRPAATPATLLFRSESDARFVPLDDSRSGALLAVNAGHIEVRPFDWKRLTLTGDPRRVDVPAGGNTPYEASMLSASRDVLIYATTGIPFGQRHASVMRDGSDQRVADDRAPQNWPRLSPDGRRLAHQRVDVARGAPELWVEDLERGTRVNVMPDRASGMLPVWSPDGRLIAHGAGWIRGPVLTVSAADGSGASRTIPCSVARCDPTDWSHDGRWLLVNAVTPNGGDIWMLDASGSGQPRPLLTGSFVERDARFSPDGRLIAYVSEENGRAEVSVRSIEGPVMRDVISVHGGEQPVWSRDGRELYFVDPDGRLRAAPLAIGPDGRPRFGASVRLGVPSIGFGHFGTQYDVSAGGRVYYLDRRREAPPPELEIVLGWRALVR